MYGCGCMCAGGGGPTSNIEVCVWSRYCRAWRTIAPTPTPDIKQYGRASSESSLSGLTAANISKCIYLQYLAYGHNKMMINFICSTCESLLEKRWRYVCT